MGASADAVASSSVRLRLVRRLVLAIKAQALLAAFGLPEHVAVASDELAAIGAELDARKGLIAADLTAQEQQSLFDATRRQAVIDQAHGHAQDQHVTKIEVKCAALIGFARTQDSGAHEFA